MTLIDEEPDYLSIAPDLSFRSRSRYLDEPSGEWVSETEVIESASELVELYNPADIFAAFAEAARQAAGMPPNRPLAGICSSPRGSRPDEAVSLGEDPYAAAADSWAAGQPASESLGRRRGGRPTALRPRARIPGAQPAQRVAPARGVRGSRRPALAALVGDLIIVDDDDERLILGANGGFRAEVIPEDADGEWRTLTGPEDLVEFYDPTDVFGDLADALAEAFPSIAPDFARRRGRRRGATATRPTSAGDDDTGDDGTPTRTTATTTTRTTRGHGGPPTA